MNDVDDDFMLDDSQDEAGAIVSPAALPGSRRGLTADSSNHISSSHNNTPTITRTADQSTSLKVRLNITKAPSANAQAPSALPAAPATNDSAPTLDPVVLSQTGNSPPPHQRKARRIFASTKRAAEAAPAQFDDEIDLLHPPAKTSAPIAAAPPAASGSQAISHSQASSSNQTVPTSSLTPPPEAAPLAKAKKGGAKKKASAVVAISEDEDMDEVLREIEATNDKISEADSDFEGGPKRGAKGKGKGKGKAVAKKVAAKAKKAPAVKGRGRGKKKVVEEEQASEAEPMDVDQERVADRSAEEVPALPALPEPSPTKAAKLKSDRRLVLESDEDEEAAPSPAAAAPPVKATPVAIKPTDPTTKPRTSGPKGKEQSFSIEVPSASKRAAPPAKVSPPAAAAKGKGRGRAKKSAAVVADSEEDAVAFDSDAESAILTGDDEDDAPVKGRKTPARGKQGAQKKAATPAKKAAGSSQLSQKDLSPIALKTASGWPRRLSAADRERLMMLAAEEEVVEDSAPPPPAPVAKGKANGRGKAGARKAVPAKVVDDEEEEDKEMDADAEEEKEEEIQKEVGKEVGKKVGKGPEKRDEDEEKDDGSDKENVGTSKPAPPRPTVGTPAPAFTKSHVPNRAATPGSAFATPRPAKGVGRILYKLSNSGLRPPGLSAKAKIPRLHANLREAPKARPVVPQVKARPKKSDKVYGSDEEAPWYEVKPHEEWDSGDEREYAKVRRRKERGWSSD